MELNSKQTEQISIQEMDILQKRAPVIGVRHLQSLLLFLAVCSGYLLRVNLSVTIVAMNPEINSTDYIKEISYHIPMFRWPSATRSVLLSSFFVGYLLANFPASVLGCRFDKKTLLACSMFATSTLAIISPSAVLAFGAPALIVIRFLQGLTSAFMFPMVHGIMARWAPPLERGRLVGFIMSGVQLGTMVTLASSGVLASTRFGWPIVYYASGAVGIAWTALWLLLGAESMSKHRFLGTDEKQYIQASLSNTSSHQIKLSSTPWKSIFTSMPVWAITVSHVGHNLGFWLLLTEMPTFINTVLKFNVKDDGILSALPYMAMFLLQFPVSYIADLLNKRKYTTLTISRKVWNTISMWGGAVGLAVLGYIENTAWTIAIYVFIVAIGCTSNAGYNINHMDLSTNYAGLLMGITNTVAASGGMTAPIFVGYIIHDQNSIEQWRIVFITGAVVLFVSNLFFIIFGSAETQPWNSIRKGAPESDNISQE